ncbi:hypothetical protein CVT24_012179 [Panaeolus cyanescens]|uniref:Uncharacterized protein n=1 Tax=Panaeolus cyanescens TaxID=181874 RepID=A0A409YIZ7_9AGAR|nr:hypothetical protein CVT24_012179 [Panaeolus cyanescens]
MEPTPAGVFLLHILHNLYTTREPDLLLKRMAKKKKDKAKKSRSKWSPARLEYLLSQKSGFEIAFRNKDTKNWFANCYRRFLKRFPPTLGEHEDPAKDVLDAVDDTVADEYELLEPKEESMSKEEYDKAMKTFVMERDRLVKVREQLQRWFYNQHGKDSSSAATNAFKGVFDEALGTGDRKPRKKSAMEIWRKSSKVKEEIEVAATAMVVEEGRPSDDLASVRQKAAKRLFETTVPAQTRRLLEAEAIEVHKTAVAEWEMKKKMGISTAPEDRQRCIDALSDVVQPLLDAICNATGWSASLIAGGPEPADQGRLHIQMIHSGVTSGAEPMDFGRAEHVRIPKLLYPMFQDFLQLVYPTDVCKSRALPSDLSWSGAPSLDSTNLPIPNNSSAGPSTVVAHTSPSRDVVHPPKDDTVYFYDSSDSSESLDEPDNTSQARPDSPAPSLAELQDVVYPSSPEPTAPDTQPDDATSHAPLLPTIVNDMPNTDSVNAGVAATANQGDRQQVDGASSDPASVPNRKRRRHVSGKEDHADSIDKGPLSKRARGGGGQSSSNIDLASLVVEPPVTVPSPSQPSVASVAAKASVDISNIRLVSSNGDSTWFTNCMTMFVTQSEPLGDDWTNCLSAYRAFQQKHGYNLERRLPTKNRPSLVTRWIGMGRTRTPKWRPQDLVPRKFNEEFKGWWADIQPEWRVENGTVKTDRVDGDWGKLFYPGANGMLSVVGCLFYWGLACQSAADKRAWTSAVLDCTVAFQALESLDVVS